MIRLPGFSRTRRECNHAEDVSRPSAAAAGPSAYADAGPVGSSRAHRSHVAHPRPGGGPPAATHRRQPGDRRGRATEGAHLGWCADRFRVHRRARRHRRFRARRQELRAGRRREHGRSLGAAGGWPGRGRVGQRPRAAVHGRAARSRQRPRAAVDGVRGLGRRDHLRRRDGDTGPTGPSRGRRSSPGAGGRGHRGRGGRGGPAGLGPGGHVRPPHRGGGGRHRRHHLDDHRLRSDGDGGAGPRRRPRPAEGRPAARHGERGGRRYRRRSRPRRRRARCRQGRVAPPARGHRLRHACMSTRCRPVRCRADPATTPTT